jgi:hypothetical protein
MPHLRTTAELPPPAGDAAFSHRINLSKDTRGKLRRSILLSRAVYSANDAQ